DEIRLQRPVVVDKLRWKRSLCAEEWTYLRARTRHPAKVTLLSAQQAAAYYDPKRSRDAYPTRDSYLADLVEITRREIEELRRLGPIGALPAVCVVVLGLVSTRKPRLEDPAELEARIRDAAGHVDLERLALSPQCGFASTMEGNRVSEADQRRKLELVVAVANSVWPGATVRA